MRTTFTGFIFLILTAKR